MQPYILITTPTLLPLRRTTIQPDLHHSMEMFLSSYGGKGRCIVTSLELMMSYETSLKMMLLFLLIIKE